MLLAILFAWLGYKKASANGRNGILWAAIAAGTFIGTQLVVSLLMGFLIGIVLVARGGAEGDYDVYTIPITIVAIVASIITGMLVLRYVDRPLEEEKYLPPPPPPNNFNQNM